ncbi:MAG: hypothetical protein NTY07_00250 [Bacteroidia bacterium]|nr:hypothetical protein [Bacteroidia bacterium]
MGLIYRFLFAFIKKCLRKLKIIYYWEKILIFLIIRQKCNRLLSSLNGYYIVTTSDFFYKICTANIEFFLYEQKSISIIKNKFPDISALVPQYNYKTLFFNKLRIMQTKILAPIIDEKESLVTAKIVLIVFRKYGEIKLITIKDLYYVAEGLKIVKYLCNETAYDEINSHINQFLAENKFYIGPAHGDFHSKNILKDGQNKYVIDLDCFREKSLQEFDALYFVVQLISDKNIITWHRALCKLLVNDFKNEKFNEFLNYFIGNKNLVSLSLLFFLDRIGQELKYYRKIDNLPVNIILQTINFFGFCDSKK